MRGARSDDERGPDRHRDDETGRPEGEHGRRTCDGDPRQSCVGETRVPRDRGKVGARPPVGWGSASLATTRGERLAQLVSKLGGTGSSCRVRVQRARDGVEQRAREVGPLTLERWRAVGDRVCHLGERDAPERVATGKRLPEHHADRPDVTRRGRFASAQALRWNVRQRAGDIADGCQRVELVELGETEVQEARRDVLTVFEDHVRRLHVPMDDPPRMRVREPLEHLRRGFDGAVVVELPGAHHLAQGASADVLVGDVDMTGVPAEVVRADTAFVAEPRCRLGLALGA